MPDSKPTADDLTALQKAIDEAVAKNTIDLADQAATEQAAFVKALEDLAVAPPVDTTDLEKAALPESVRKHIEAIEAQGAEAIAKADRLEATEKARTIEAAAKSLPFIGSAEDVAKALEPIHGTDSYDGIYSMLEKAQERIAEGDLLKTRGSDKTPAPRLEAAIAEIAKAEPGLTRSVYVSKALTADMSLYAEATSAGAA